MNPLVTKRCSPVEEAIYQDGFQAGAASRDAEIAELAGVLGNVTAHLVAAHSLLSSGVKKAAASDTISKLCSKTTKSLLKQAVKHSPDGHGQGDRRG